MFLVLLIFCLFCVIVLFYIFKFESEDKCVDLYFLETNFVAFYV